MMISWLRNDCYNTMWPLRSWWYILFVTKWNIRGDRPDCLFWPRLFFWPPFSGCGARGGSRIRQNFLDTKRDLGSDSGVICPLVERVRHQIPFVDKRRKPGWRGKFKKLYGQPSPWGVQKLPDAPLGTYHDGLLLLSPERWRYPRCVVRLIWVP